MEEKTYYVIEHLEPELSNWASLEYIHMVQLLNNMYKEGDKVGKESSNNILVFTNFDMVELEKESKENLEQFVAYAQNFNVFFVKEGLTMIRNGQKQDWNGVEELKEVLETAKLCMMDFRAEKVLCKEDK